MPPDDATPDEPFSKLIQQYQRAVENRDFGDASDTVHDIFALSEEWCDENPSPALNLTIAASEFEERADWGAAESVYNRILSLSDLEPATEYKALSDLASLCRLLGRDSDALGHACRATAAARRTDVSILLVMALQREARYLIRCGQIAEAGNAIAEAISAMDDDKLYNPLRAGTLTLRAECATCNDIFAEAECDLRAAYRLLEPLAGMDMAAGIHSDLSHWWSVTARLRVKYNDHEGSVTAWQKAVVISKHVASLTHANTVYTKLAVADMLKGLEDALLLCERTDDATAVIDERNALLRRIGVPNRDSE